MVLYDVRQIQLIFYMINQFCRNIYWNMHNVSLLYIINHKSNTFICIDLFLDPFLLLIVSFFIPVPICDRQNNGTPKMSASLSPEQVNFLYHKVSFTTVIKILSWRDYPGLSRAHCKRPAQRKAEPGESKPEKKVWTMKLGQSDGIQKDSTGPCWLWTWEGGTSQGDPWKLETQESNSASAPPERNAAPQTPTC